MRALGIALEDSKQYDMVTVAIYDAFPYTFKAATKIILGQLVWLSGDREVSAIPLDQDVCPLCHRVETGSGAITQST